MFGKQKNDKADYIIKSPYRCPKTTMFTIEKVPSIYHGIKYIVGCDNGYIQSGRYNDYDTATFLTIEEAETAIKMFMEDNIEKRFILANGVWNECEED